jgi:hypothetical protein
MIVPLDTPAASGCVARVADPGRGDARADPCLVHPAPKKNPAALTQLQGSVSLFAPSGARSRPVADDGLSSNDRPY